MNRTARARAALLASTIAALASGGCDSSPGSPPPAPAPVPATPASPAIPASTGADASGPDPAPARPARAVPTGAVRLRDASLGAAVLLTGALWDLPILALDADPPAATLAIAGPEEAGAALAAAFQTSAASSKQLLVLAPEARARAAVAAARSGRGRDVELRLDAAPGRDLVRLIGDIERLKVAGELDGSFSIVVERFPARRLLAVMAAACGASLSIRGKAARLEGSQCSPAAPRQSPSPPPSAFDDRTLPAAPIDEIRLVGVGIHGAKRLAAIAHGRTVAVVAPGTLVGARDAACERHWLASREVSPERAAVEQAIRRRDALVLELPTPRNREELERHRAAEAAATRAIEEARAAEAAAASRRKASRPSWCAGEAGELVWKVDAIDSEGVTFAPVLDPGGKPAAYAPAPGVELRRVPIAE